MNAPLHSALLAGMIDTRRPRRRNRRRRSAFRASLRRVTIAAAIAAAVTLATLAASAVTLADAAHTERMVQEIAAAKFHGGTLTPEHFRAAPAAYLSAWSAARVSAEF